MDSLHEMHANMITAATQLLEEVVCEPVMCCIDDNGLTLVFVDDNEFVLEVVLLPNATFQVEGVEEPQKAKNASKLINEWFDTQRKNMQSDEEDIPKTPPLDLE